MLWEMAVGIERYPRVAWVWMGWIYVHPLVMVATYFSFLGLCWGRDRDDGRIRKVSWLYFRWSCAMAVMQARNFSSPKCLACEC